MTEERDAFTTASADPTIGILSLVLSQLGDTERRILHRMDENARAAASRWRDHETEHAEILRLVRQLRSDLDCHLDTEKAEALIMEARLGPIRTAGRWISREWRTVVIVILLLLELSHQTLDMIVGQLP